MPFVDLQDFLRHLERLGELRRVKVEVDPRLEITEIVTRVVREEGPALLFERVRGSPFPLAINILGNRRRIEEALGRPPAEVGEELARLLERLNPPSVRSFWEMRGGIRRALNLRLRRVRRAACQEISEEPDLDRLPILTCWPEDGGRFITEGLVFTRDPLTRRSNLGIYRMHVYDRRRTGMHWQIQKGGGFHYYQAEKRGEPLPVAVVLGGDPSLILSAVLPLPEGFEEVLFSGWLRGAPTPMVRGLTIDLDYPANAEMVLEGVVPPFEREMEGPFGDHFGHYSHAAPFPVFHLQRIVRRKSPVYPAAVVGKPPQEDRYLGDAAQEMLIPLLKLLHPELRDLWAYYEAGFHNLVVAAVEARYPREALKTSLGLLGQGQMSLTKCIVLVDPEVDVRDFRGVLRAIRDHFHPPEDFILISRATLDTLDFTSSQMHLGSKMILDATGRNRPPARRAAPRIPDLRDLEPRVLRWALWEETLLAVQVRAGGREVVERLVQTPELEGVPMVVAVSPDVDVTGRESLIWGIFTRFDPARDIVFERVELRGAWPVYHGRMGIDATWKEGYPKPLEMIPEIQERVRHRWKEYFPEGYKSA